MSEPAETAPSPSVDNLFAPVAGALERSGHAYCVLHGWDRLGDCSMSDVDLAVSRSALAVLEQSLELNAWNIVQLRNYEIGAYFFIARQAGTRNFLRIDAITEFRDHGRLYLSGDQLLANPGKFCGFTIAAPQAEFAYLLAKKVLKAAIPERQRLRLASLYGCLAQQALLLARQLFGPKWGELLIRWIEQERWDELGKRLPVMRRELRKQALRRYSSRFILDLPRGVRRLTRRILQPTGLVIALLGPDGSGKSTVAQALAMRLSPIFGAIRQYRERPDIFHRINYELNSQPHARPLLSKSKSLVKLLFLLVDNGVGFQFKVRYPIIRDHLVIFDRYYHDLLVDPIRYRFGGPMWAARWAATLIPRPDLFLVLDCPEPVVLSRKRELPLEMLTRLRTSYRGMTIRFGRVRIIDASADRERVVSAAEEVVCEYLHQRYLARRHLWFHPTRPKPHGDNKSTHQRTVRIDWRVAK